MLKSLAGLHADEAEHMQTNRKKKKRVRRPKGKADPRAIKRAKSNRNPKHSSELFYITEPSLFDEEEGTFINYFTRRRVKVHLVPAPWTRVILLSLLYAFAITFIKFGYFYPVFSFMFFGLVGGIVGGTVYRFISKRL